MGRKKGSKGIPYRTILTEEQMAEIAIRYETGERIHHLTREFKIGTQKMYGILKSRGIAVLTRSKALTRYAIDQSAFDELTSEALYWLGFLATDGYVHLPSAKGSKLQVCLKLAAVDKSHVLTFRDFLRSDAPLTEAKNKNDKPYVMFRQTAPDLCSRLFDLGITERKTWTLDVPEELAESPDFWRGALDGDGSIEARGTVSFLSASGTFFNSFWAFCLSVGITGGCFAPTKRGHFKATIGGRDDVVALLSATYDRPGPVLARKRERAENILSPEE